MPWVRLPILIKPMRSIALPILLAIATNTSHSVAESNSDLRRQANDALQRGEYCDCADRYDQILASGESSIGALYSAATCYSLALQNDKAFAVLERTLATPLDRNSYFFLVRLTGDRRLRLECLLQDPRWAVLVERTALRKSAFLAEQSSPVFSLFISDQEDRWSQPLDPVWLSPRDRERREVAAVLYADHCSWSAEDFDEAALLFQHGSDSRDYLFAHKLALQAHALQPESLGYRWTVAATLDRYLWSTCQPQVFGTQFQVTDGRYTIEPLDETLFTDSDREQWGVPALRSSREREKRLNESRPH